jgi:hypothetical protein
MLFHVTDVASTKVHALYVFLACSRECSSLSGFFEFPLCDHSARARLAACLVPRPHFFGLNVVKLPSGDCQMTKKHLLGKRRPCCRVQCKYLLFVRNCCKISPQLVVPMLYSNDLHSKSFMVSLVLEALDDACYLNHESNGDIPLPIAQAFS